MKTSVDKPNEDVQIQIIPLIDVIFCILTFFILASLQLTRQQAVNVNVPKVPAGGATASEQTPGRAVISIDALGGTAIDGRPVDRAQLRLIVQQYYQRNPNGQMTLYADKNALYDNILQVFSVMQEVGGDRVSLGVVPESTTGGATPSPNPTFNPNANPNPNSTFNPANPNANPNPNSTFNPANPNANPNPNSTLPLFPYSNTNPYSNPGSGTPLPGQNPLNPNPANPGSGNPGLGNQRP